jgi:hypothetical protein
MRHATLMQFTAIAVLAMAAPAIAGEVAATSTIDTVTVYPDGATVTRIISANLPAGDTTLISRDFPPGLDPASLRVEGEGQSRLVIGAIDARPPRAERPPTNPELEKRIETLRDERGTLDDRIASAAARRRFAERFAETSPAALGDKGEAVILSDGDLIFQAAKIGRSGLARAVDGRVLIYEHKEARLDDVRRRFPAERYVLVDDKPRILAAVKRIWGERVTTVLPLQGQYANDAQVVASLPAADRTVERIGDLLSYDFSALVTKSR